ncbi:MAG: FAD-dependent oxidoreductase [Victivallaceae bacterium]|nr:FAD-dependent oxidoreductase [Victivallaceae bacterium]
MKVIIVGGVAAGAGTASRLRRLDESAQIILLERGKYISFANCGLPYHIGGVIEDRSDLLVMPEAKFRAWFNVDVRTGNEATAIHRDAKTLDIRRADGTIYTESYDRLVLATGSSPLDTKFPGASDPGVFRLWTIPDMDGINAAIEAGAKRAVVVGGGFIGLETAENLKRRGLMVTVIQHSGHVLPTLDCEMAAYLHNELAALGIDLRLNAEFSGFSRSGSTLTAELKDGSGVECDIAILSVGVKPNSELARAAGLELAERGHIVVNDRLETSDPAIFAAGDAVAVIDPVSSSRVAVPLAGPANKQARIVADNIAGRDSRYRGTYGASVIKVGNIAAATVGLNESRLKQLGIVYHKIYTHPASNAGYYPTSAQLHIKFMFAPDGKILGSQIVGPSKVAKRIDTIACAMECGRTAPELAELEFAYSPPYSSAKDPVNFLGMIAQNVLNGDTTPVYADAIPADAVVLDVRQDAENRLGSIPGAVNIPLGELRRRLNELDRGRLIVVCCQVGLRGYLAERILKQNGFNAANLSGGYLTWRTLQTAPCPRSPFNCCGDKR